MTEIKIEKKRPMWPWLSAVFGLTALIIYFMFYNDNSAVTTVVTKTADLVTVKEQNATVIEFVSYIDDDSMHMSLDHTFTHNALVKLADAIKAMAAQVGFEITVNLDRIKEYAETITKKPLVNTHADSIRKATDLASTALQNLQQAKYPELASEATNLLNASAAINPDVLTLDQKKTVKTFFRIAADLLKKMN